MGCVQSQDWAETRTIPYILPASIDQSEHAYNSRKYRAILIWRTLKLKKKNTQKK